MMIETTDIFRGAFFLCMGSSLDGIKLKNNNSQIASFLFTGKNIDKHDCDYMTGRALVNPVQFRESLNWLRDNLYTMLRDKKGRYDDRKRKNRLYQK